MPDNSSCVLVIVMALSPNEELNAGTECGGDFTAKKNGRE
jgi:hypothetical protein